MSIPEDHHRSRSPSAGLALGGGEPVNELQTPMAIVILDGLLSATALNMIVLPALYWMYGDRTVAVAGAEDILVPDHRVHGAPVLVAAR